MCHSVVARRRCWRLHCRRLRRSRLGNAATRVHIQQPHAPCPQLKGARRGGAVRRSTALQVQRLEATPRPRAPRLASDVNAQAALRGLPHMSAPGHATRAPLASTERLIWRTRGRSARARRVFSSAESGCCRRRGPHRRGVSQRRIHTPCDCCALSTWRR